MHCFSAKIRGPVSKNGRPEMFMHATNADEEPLEIVGHLDELAIVILVVADEADAVAESNCTAANMHKHPDTRRSIWT